MNAIYIILGLAVIACIFWAVERIRLRKYAARSCQGRAWKQAFPTARKEEIREFLGLFVGAFALPSRLKLRLRPDDRPVEIYDIVTAGIDSMEFESFSVDLEKRFGRGLNQEMDDSWTLGDIFRHINPQVEPDASGQRR
jgi:hypothetical protein